MTCNDAASRQLQQNDATRQSNEHNATTKTMQEQWHNNYEAMMQWRNLVQQWQCNEATIVAILAEKTKTHHHPKIALQQCWQSKICSALHCCQCHGCCLLSCWLIVVFEHFCSTGTITHLVASAATMPLLDCAMMLLPSLACADFLAQLLLPSLACVGLPAQLLLQLADCSVYNFLKNYPVAS